MTARESPALRDEPTTLREMLEFVADWAHECAEGDEPDNFYGFAEIEGQCRAALATPEPAPAVDNPFDPERGTSSFLAWDAGFSAGQRATPEPAPAVLDEERLGEAVFRVGIGHRHRESAAIVPIENSPDGARRAGEFAVHVAREYAALTATPSEATE